MYMLTGLTSYKGLYSLKVPHTVNANRMSVLIVAAELVNIFELYQYHKPYEYINKLSTLSSPNLIFSWLATC